MAKTQRKKQKLHAKYILRRLTMLVVLLGLIGGSGWYMWGRLNGEADSVDGSVAEDLLGVQKPVEGEPAESSDPQGEEQMRQVPEPEPEPEVQELGWELLLVNFANPLPDNFEVELETLSDGYIVDVRIADPLKQMIAQAKADGISLMLCSGYRTLERQTINFEAKKEEYLADGFTEEDAVAATSTIIAVPGTSEHHTGLAVDIVTPTYQNLDEGFEETLAFRWLDQHAEEYGFVLRYPRDKENYTKIIYEPWHYRYVGVEHARIMNENNYCLEQYVYILETQAQEAAERRVAQLKGTTEDEDLESGEYEESEE